MELKLDNVRIAFATLYEARKVDEKSDPAFSGSFLIPKKSPLVKKVNAAIDLAAKDKWQDKAPGVLKALRASDKVCLQDGDTKSEYEGFADHFFVSARSKGRPIVLNRDKSPLTKEDGKPYSGCFVNVVLDIWAQEHPKHGKRVNAALKGVQFVRDGDSFGGGTPASPDAFDDLGDGADADDIA